MKSAILAEVDKYLFTSTLQNLRKVYKEAKRINKNRHFSYSLFTATITDVNDYRNAIITPSPATLEYLAPIIEEYTPIIRRRELIQCFILQFLNQAENLYWVEQLLPAGLRKHLQHTVDARLHGENFKVTLPLVEIFKQKPEYEMIKQQEIFMTMGL